MVVKKRKPKLLLIIIIFCAFLLLGMGITWIFLTSPVDKGNTDDVEVLVASGMSTSEIGQVLKDKKLIKSDLLFKIYVKLYKVNSLKADTYVFNKSMDLMAIVEKLEAGSDYKPDMIKMTFKEGQRITDYALVISNNTNNSYDEVMAVFGNSEYIKKLISKYWFLTDAILNPSIYYPLEGYLAPDTYHFDNKDVKVESIIEAMLNLMDKKLSKYKSSIGSNVHHYMTMASIVELEGTKTDNRKMIVGVFNNRLNNGMNLGSDVTTYYGLQAAMTSDLTVEEFASVNAYNTRAVAMVGKMPVGPICNPSESSIEASINPTQNNYLFFVADKNGNIFYTRTNKEHEQKVAEIKAKGDWIW